MFVLWRYGILNIGQVTKIQFLDKVEQEVPSMDHPGEKVSIYSDRVCEWDGDMQNLPVRIQVFERDGLSDYIDDPDNIRDIIQAALDW